MPLLSKRARTCAETGLFLVDNDAIADVVSDDETARKIIESSQQVMGVNLQLVPYYRKALEKVAAGKEQRALVRSNWLEYAETKDACILDFDPLEAEAQKGMKGGISERDAAAYVQTYTDRITALARKHLAPERILQLPRGATDAKKAELAIPFVRKFQK